MVPRKYVVMQVHTHTCTHRVRFMIGLTWPKIPAESSAGTSEPDLTWEPADMPLLCVRPTCNWKVTGSTPTTTRCPALVLLSKTPERDLYKFIMLFNLIQFWFSVKGDVFKLFYLSEPWLLINIQLHLHRWEDETSKFWHFCERNNWFTVIQTVAFLCN